MPLVSSPSWVAPDNSKLSSVLCLSTVKIFTTRLSIYLDIDLVHATELRCDRVGNVTPPSRILAQTDDDWMPSPPLQPPPLCQQSTTNAHCKSGPPHRHTCTRTRQPSIIRRKKRAVTKKPPHQRDVTKQKAAVRKQRCIGPVVKSDPHVYMCGGSRSVSWPGCQRDSVSSTRCGVLAFTSHWKWLSSICTCSEKTRTRARIR